MLVNLYVGDSYALKVMRSSLFSLLIESGLFGGFSDSPDKRWVGRPQAARLQHPLGCA